jgi:hypothetical protein
MDIPCEFVKIEGFRCPAEFWAAFGYAGRQRHVGLWWERCGDEASFCDGEYTVVGAEWPAYLTLVDHPRNWPLVEPHNLGDSDTEADEMLVLDREDPGAAWAAPRADAERWLHEQAWPGLCTEPDDLEFLEAETELTPELIEAALNQAFSRLREVERFESVEDLMRDRAAKLDALQEALDRG